MASTTLLLMADYIFWLKSHNCTTKGSLGLHCESLLLKYPIKHLKVTFLFTEMTHRSTREAREREHKRGIDWLHSPPSRFCCPLPFCSVLVIILSLSLSLLACFAHLTSLQWLTARKSTKHSLVWSPADPRPSPMAHLGPSWVIQAHFPAVHRSIALITVWQATAEARKHCPSFSPANPFSKVTDPQLTAQLPATNCLQREEFLWSVEHACLPASFWKEERKQATAERKSRHSSSRIQNQQSNISRPIKNLRESTFAQNRMSNLYVPVGPGWMSTLWLWVIYKIT